MVLRTFAPNSTQILPRNMSGSSQTTPRSNAQESNVQPPAPAHPKSWLTRRVEESPAAYKFFLGLASTLGYTSAKQTTGRHAFSLYEQVCASAPDVDPAFWKDSCHLPPTFQSWFTVTNLHIWLLTVRLRALPSPEGQNSVQALLDHFFLDVEDRIRAVLQPKEIPLIPYTFYTPFYVNPNDGRVPVSRDPTDPTQPPQEDVTAKADPPAQAEKPTYKSGLRARAPDRLVNKQMKIFKEQWAGLGIAFDLALIQGDAELAAAAWRNLLGARGAGGIALPEQGEDEAAKFRRSVNLVGGEVVDVSKMDVNKEEGIDDGSGVHDFPPSQSEKYIAYPEVMQDIVTYIRRELVRLDALTDEELMEGGIDRIKFGKVRA